MAGSYKIEYDFFDGGDADYAFSGSAALTFTKPESTGSGAMNVNYCYKFNGDNPNPYVAVQTGFERDGIIPLRLAKYEQDKTDTYDDSVFVGEYDCASNKLIVGFTGLHDGNAYTTNIAVKDDDLVLTDDGCLED